MIVVALCGKNDELQSNAAALVERCAQGFSPEQVAVERFSSSISLTDRIVQSSFENMVDLVICDDSLPGVMCVDVVRELRSTLGEDLVPRFAICAETPEGALAAQGQLVEDYLVKPILEEQFAEMVRRHLAAIADEHERSVALKCRDGARRVKYSKIVFSETSNHDQVLHLADGRRLEVRASSQALFDQLGADRGFFKAGSSYIVNTAHVQRVRSSGASAELTGGFTINIPVRLRKPFEEALLAR